VAHLWVRDGAAQWAIASLDCGQAFALRSDPAAPVRLRSQRQKGKNQESAIIVRRQKAGEETWVLISRDTAHVRVNGLPLVIGMKVLQDRDQIRVDGVGRMFFSTERLPHVEVFTGSEKAVFCPRCKSEILDGSRAVRCPQCEVWHHQSEELPCWTYSERCALCDQPTDLNASYRWTPEGL